MLQALNYGDGNWFHSINTWSLPVFQNQMSGALSRMLGNHRSDKKKNRISEESVPKTFGYIFTTISLGNGKKRCRLQELQTNYFPIAFFPKYNLLQKLKSATLFSVRWQVRINGLNITFDFDKQLCWLEANCFFNQNPCYFQQGIRRNRNKAKFHLVQQKYLSTGRGVGE